MVREMNRRAKRPEAEISLRPLPQTPITQERGGAMGRKTDKEEGRSSVIKIKPQISLEWKEDRGATKPP